MVTYFNLIILIFLALISFGFFYLLKEIKSLKEKKEENYEEKILNFFQSLEIGILDKFNILKEELNKKFTESLEREKKLLETGSKLEEIARNLSVSLEETKEIKNILSGPKTRGHFGEIMIEEILRHLPSNYYEKQYKLGLDIVDYVIKFNEKIIPIDAKFPYFKSPENLSDEEKKQRKKEIINNLKSKIDSVAKKYIQPYRNYVDFAIIYLANEGVYYELLSDKDYEEIWSLAKERNIILTSPKNFEILISSLLLVLKKQEIAQNLNYILDELSQIEKDLKTLEETFEKAFTQLNNSFKNLNEFSRALMRFSLSLRNLLNLKNKEIKIKERSLI